MTKGISFFDFTLLPDEQQYELVFTDAEFMDVREVGSSKYVLYKLYGFCVELEYNILQNKIVNEFVFKKGL